MLTISADFLAQRALKRATRELRAAIPDGAEYNEVRNKINGLPDLLNDLNSFINDIRISHPKVYDEVILMSEKSQVDFMFDFEGNKALLDQLDANPHLIPESWENIIELKSYRRDISTLRRYREVVNNEWLQTHTNFGHTKFRDSGTGTFSEGISTGGHNVNNYVSPPPSTGGKVSWKIPPPIKYTDPKNPNNSYSLGTTQRNLSDMVDPKTGSNWAGGLKLNGTRGGPLKNKTKNACWPKNYDTRRINEEKAVILGKINLNTKINHIIDGQYFYEIPATDGHPIIVIFDGNPNYGGKLNNIFPSNDPKLFQ